GWRVLFGQAAARLGRSDDPRQPDLLHGQRVPLWPAGRQRRAAVGCVRADAGLRGGADGAGVVVVEAGRGVAQLSWAPVAYRPNPRHGSGCAGWNRRQWRCFTGRQALRRPAPPTGRMATTPEET